MSISATRAGRWCSGCWPTCCGAASAPSPSSAATIATTHQFCQQVLRSLGVAGTTDASATLVEDLDDLLVTVDDLAACGVDLADLLAEVRVGINVVELRRDRRRLSEPGRAAVERLLAEPVAARPAGGLEAVLTRREESEGPWRAELLAEHGLLDGLPENLRSYFDFAAFARDLELSGDVYEGKGGHLFNGHA